MQPNQIVLTGTLLSYKKSSFTADGKDIVYARALVRLGTDLYTFKAEVTNEFSDALDTPIDLLFELRPSTSRPSDLKLIGLASNSEE